jgi:hypothetical protein
MVKNERDFICRIRSQPAKGILPASSVLLLKKKARLPLLFAGCAPHRRQFPHDRAISGVR